MQLSELLAQKPIAPFIRQSDMAIRRPWTHPERRLLDYLLIFVKEGRCRFTVDGVPYDFQAGEFCLIQPGQLNELEGLTNTITPFAHFDIFYHPDRKLSFPTRPGQVDLSPYLHLMQPKLSDLQGVRIPVRLRPRDSGKYRDIVLQAVSLWQSQDPLDQLRTQNIMTELVLAILEDHAEERGQAKESDHTLSWIPSYLSYNLQESLSIEKMAERAHMSPSYFSALFKRRFGRSPHRYLIDMRIEHAKELLSGASLTRDEIASYCGFSDIHHFSKMFRKITGMTPGEWSGRRNG
ncbi:helix-turn-helix domain-containing protein [Cohnella soli]|uniref:Helix-turn-helix domain-containing protein n=1 Tax=Cohnella soli TaxID=425005 RepID=A0ABW0I374_9BACL